MGRQLDLHLLGQLPDPGVDHRLEQALLAAELRIERRQRTAGPLDDLGHVGRLVAVLQEDIASRLEERRPPKLRAPGFRFGCLCRFPLGHSFSVARSDACLILGQVSLHFN